MSSATASLAHSVPLPARPAEPLTVLLAPGSVAVTAANAGFQPPRRHPAALAGIAALHLAGLWGLLHVTLRPMQPPAPEPLFVSTIAESAPPPAELPVLAAPQPHAPPPLMVVPVPEVQPLAPPPPDAPAAMAVATPQPAPAPVAAPAPLLAAVAPEPARLAPPQEPRLLPSNAIQFIEPPEVVYPRLSRKNREAGTVVVRALVGPEGGHPRSLVVHRSSGHPRLDEAALAAVQKARFKAWVEQGRAVEAWALVPIQFELEN